MYSIAGLVAAALTTRFLLPRLAPDGAPGTGLRRHLGRGTARAAAWLPRLRWPLGLLTLAALGFVLLQPSPWRGSLAALSPVTSAAIALDASLRQDLGAPDGSALVAIEASSEAAALERAEQLGERLDALVDQGLLLGYESPAEAVAQPAHAGRPAGSPARRGRPCGSGLPGPPKAGRWLRRGWIPSSRTCRHSAACRW